MKPPIDKFKTLKIKKCMYHLIDAVNDIVTKNLCSGKTPGLSHKHIDLFI